MEIASVSSLWKESVCGGQWSQPRAVRAYLEIEGGLSGQPGSLLLEE